MLFHVMEPVLKRGEGPIALIVTPTRELAKQIEKECFKFLAPFNITTVSAYEGRSRWDQFLKLKEGQVEVG